MSQAYTHDIWSRGYTNAATIDAALLLQRLAQTVKWCLPLQRHADLRSPALPVPQFHQGADDLVCRLGRSRAQQLRQSKTMAPRLPALAGGKLMLYFPEEDLSCGLAEAASGSFFDIFNTPPADTWVSYFDDGAAIGRRPRPHLLCYIPPQFLAVAREGIAVNPESCICWLSDSDMPLHKRYGDFNLE